MTPKTTVPSIPLIDEQLIETTLGQNAEPSKARIAGEKILAKAAECKGLDSDEIASLAAARDAEDLHGIFIAAKRVKEHIYGRRLVLFAPLYVSNLCANECVYCAFRAKNKLIARKALSRKRSSGKPRPSLTRATSASFSLRASRTRTRDQVPARIPSRPFTG